MNCIVPISSMSFHNLPAVPLILHLGTLSSVVYTIVALTQYNYCIAASPAWYFMGEVYFSACPGLGTGPTSLRQPPRSEALFPSPLLLTPSLSPTLALSTWNFLCYFPNHPSYAIDSRSLCEDANFLPQSQVLKGRMIISLLLPNSQKPLCSQKGSLISDLQDQSVPESPLLVLPIIWLSLHQEAILWPQSKCNMNKARWQ